MAINRSLFRQKALEHYQQIQTPKVLPRFVAPLTIFWYWILFFGLVAAVVMLWSVQIPVSVQGSGVIRHLTASELQNNKLPVVKGQNGGVYAMMLFPERAATSLRQGSSVSVVITGTAQPVTGKVESIDVAVMPADQIRQFGASATSQAPSQPMTVAFISLGTTVVSGKPDGVRVMASYQSGTTAILPLLLSTISLGGS